MWTIPNILAFVRLAASPLLVILALMDMPTAFLVATLLLLLDDWLDGKLAIWLKQQTTFGARLDSAADATLYACLLLGVVRLKGDYLSEEIAWIAAAVGSYAVTTLAGLAKFRRIPSYHTRGAKVSWLLVAVAVGMLFLWEPHAHWPLRVAMAGVSLTNLEATLITLLLPAWQPNVLSIFHARRHLTATTSAPPPGVGAPVAPTPRKTANEQR